MAVFDLEAAHRLLPRIRELTARAATAVDALITEGKGAGPEARVSIEKKVRRIVETWAEEVTDLGGHVKGVWLVDFDNGNGFWCWQHPEATIEYTHGYDEGFSGRRLIEPAVLH